MRGSVSVYSCMMAIDHKVRSEWLITARFQQVHVHVSMVLQQAWRIGWIVQTVPAAEGAGEQAIVTPH